MSHPATATPTSSTPAPGAAPSTSKGKAKDVDNSMDTSDAPTTNKHWKNVVKTLRAPSPPPSSFPMMSFGGAARALSPSAYIADEAYAVQLGVSAVGSSSRVMPPVNHSASFKELVEMVPASYRDAAAPMLNGAVTLCKRLNNVVGQELKLKAERMDGKNVPVELSGCHAPNYSYLSSFEGGTEYAAKFKANHDAYIKQQHELLIEAKGAERQSCEEALRPSTYAPTLREALLPTYRALKKYDVALTVKPRDGGDEMEVDWEEAKVGADEEFAFALEITSKCCSRLVQIERAHFDRQKEVVAAKKELKAEAEAKAGSAGPNEDARLKKLIQDALKNSGVSPKDSKKQPKNVGSKPTITKKVEATHRVDPKHRASGKASTSKGAQGKAKAKPQDTPKVGDKRKRDTPKASATPAKTPSGQQQKKKQRGDGGRT